jgi:4-amino-4-deoxy-L-arabinose transferase-like glycosyltransferase
MGDDAISSRDETSSIPTCRGETHARPTADQGRRWRSFLPLIALTAFAGALRFGLLRHQSFWFDEAATIDLVHKSFWGMIKAIPNDESTPPLYYVVAWGWSRAFGTGEFGLRSLSALFGTATVPVAYAAARVFVSRRAGLFAAAMVACSPMLVWYSQEARGYALLGLLSAGSVFAFGQVLQQPGARPFAIWAAVACLALATHYFAVFLIGAEAIWLLCALKRLRAARISVAVTAFVGAALLPLALHQSDKDRTDWITGRPLGSRIREAVREFVTGQYTPGHQAALIAASVAVGVVACTLIWLADGRQRRGAGVVLTLGVAALVVPLVLAPTSFDKFYYRNLIGALVVLAIGFGCALASRRARRLTVAIVVLVCATELAALAVIERRPTLQRDDWRSAVRALGPTDVPVAIVTDPWWERSAIAAYRSDVRPMPRDGARVADIVFVGLSPLPLDYRPPNGFVQVDERKAQRVALVRYHATAPRAVTAAEITAGGFSPDGVLLAPAPR